MKSFVDCGNPAPENGKALLPSGTLLNATAAVSCNTGYEIKGDNMITCLDTGWSDSPLCELLGR